MEDVTLTASGVISFAEQLEDSSEEFYEMLAGRFPEDGERLLAFAKESRKNKVVVVRTYQETITDALEACFSFEGLDLRNYAADTVVPEAAGYSEALKVALALEDTAIRFYTEVAEHSESLLATIPRTLKRVARKRSKRKAELQSLLERATGDS